MDPFIAKMARTLRGEGLLAPGEAVLVGVSGGPDSVALLAALAELSGPMRLSVGAAHVNHGLRGADSDRDQDAVALLAARLGLSLLTHRLDPAPAGNLEQWARDQRYRFLFTAAAGIGARKVAVAHHADDAAETVLINLIRGAGASGLAGIAPLRPAGPDHPGLFLIRPLIRHGRDETLAFLDRYHLAFREDPSNLDLTRLRNRLRHVIIPQLAEINPRIRQTLARAAQVSRHEAQLIQHSAEEWLKQLSQTRENGISLDLAALRLAPAGLRLAVYRQAILRLAGTLTRIAFSHLDALDRIVVCSSPHAHLDLPGLQVERSYDLLKIILGVTPAVPGVSPPATRIVPLRGTRGSGWESLPIPGQLSWPATPDPWLITAALAPRPAAPPDPRAEAWLDPAQLSLPLLVGARRPGDRYAPFGLAGSRKVKDIMIDLKIPLPDRAAWPLIRDQHRILWLPGLRPAHRLNPGLDRVIILRASR
jgi:tRNA(Ile)-lysidine synthase